MKPTGANERGMRLTTIEKSLKLIELLGNYPRGLSLAQVTTQLGLPKSSVHHILQTLLYHDYVRQDPDTKSYFLGFQILQLSSKMLESFDVRGVAKRYLLQLHDRCNETTQLYILRKGRLVCIDKIDDPSGGLAISAFVGWTTEPHPAASGKVLVSELSPKQLLDIYPEKVLRVYGKNTICDFDELLRELETVRKQGYAIDDEEYYEGVRCVAAPIRAGGKIVASVSVTGSIFGMTMKKIQELIPVIIATGEKISNEMIKVRM